MAAPRQGRISRDNVPDGWERCPRWGDPRKLHGLNIIPCKVPLCGNFDAYIEPDAAWCLGDAIRELHSKKLPVGLVIDLTNSRLYYNFAEEMSCLPPELRRGVDYIKVPCRGRGQSPQPSDVNTVVFHICQYSLMCPDRYILLHCTHGFNRTGYIIVNALMRLRHMPLRAAIHAFAAARPPGIYKDDYINDLFKYHHYRRDPLLTITPPVPQWKGVDAEDAADAANEEGQADKEGDKKQPEAPPAAELRHDTIFEIGERICDEEQAFLQENIYNMITAGAHRRPHERVRFPGQQPVSLSAGVDTCNLKLLYDNRYWVTWKADGTRYLMLILDRGVYLVDRSYNIVRVQMRFPKALPKDPPVQRPCAYPVGLQQHTTLLDGEMVVDHDTVSHKATLRYLIYDLILQDGLPHKDKPFRDRVKNIMDWVVKPRKTEQAYIEAPHLHQGAYWSAPLPYDYAAEPFHVRQKDFWPVNKIDKVLSQFHDPTRVGHESDGLILQPCDELYFMGTCDTLLKWKYAHMNSVDFKLECRLTPDGQLDTSGAAQPLRLFLLDARGPRGGAPRMVPLEDVDKGQRCEFPPGIDPVKYHGKIIECNYIHEVGNLWRFMRERIDKDTPNASHIYKKIKDSILYQVDQEDLVGQLKFALMNSEAYVPDRQMLKLQERDALQHQATDWYQRKFGQPEDQYQEQGQQGYEQGYEQGQSQGSGAYAAQGAAGRHGDGAYPDDEGEQGEQEMQLDIGDEGDGVGAEQHRLHLLQQQQQQHGGAQDDGNGYGEGDGPQMHGSGGPRRHAEPLGGDRSPKRRRVDGQAHGVVGGDDACPRYEGEGFW